MRLSFSTNAFVRFSVTEAIAIIAGAGYSGVELLADAPHLYALSTSDSDLAEVAHALEKTGLLPSNINANTAVGYYGRKFWEPLFEPSLASPDSCERKWRVQYTKKCIDMARALSCPNISITSGRMVPGIAPARSMALLRESLDEVLEYAAVKEIRIGMEYEPGLLVECYSELKELMDTLGAVNFGANLDFGHSHVLGEDPKLVIEGLSSEIFHVHLEDISGRKHYHLIPGDGDIDFGVIRQGLDDISYSGFIAVELYTYPDNPEDAALRAFQHLEPLGFNRAKRT